MKSKRALCGWEDSGGLRECPDVEKEMVRISYIFDFSLTVLVSDTLPPSTRLHLPGHLSQTPSVCLCDAAHRLAKAFPLISLPSNQEFLFWTEPVDCILKGTRVSQGPGEFSLPAPFLTLATLISLNYGRILLNLVSWVSSSHQVWEQRLPSIPTLMKHRVKTVLQRNLKKKKIPASVRSPSLGFLDS